MTDYREADFSRLKTVPIAQRPNKVDPSLLAHPPGGDPSFTAFWDSLPDILAAKDLRTVARQLAQAAGRRGVVAMLGGHVIKVGLGPLLRELIRRGVITHLALNGSAAIHDFELAAYGGTSEDVAAGLADGTFGMAEETGREMNAAIGDGARAGMGMGEALVTYLARRPQLAAREVSVLVAAGEWAVPVTVHATLGADIIHQHPAADGAALGATTHREFTRLAASPRGARRRRWERRTWCRRWRDGRCSWTRRATGPRTRCTRPRRSSSRMRACAWGRRASPESAPAAGSPSRARR